MPERKQHHPGAGARRRFAGALLAILAATAAQAAECPAPPAQHLPQASSPLNIDDVKQLLRAYHRDHYVEDIAAVFAGAQMYVERRAAEVEKPAVVLDIDETSLSNWQNLDLDDFGFIAKGPCPKRPGFACGFASYIASETSAPIEPARKFFDAVRAKQVAVFFITGRRDSQRKATVTNLRLAGFRGWTRLATRPDDDKTPSIVPFKSGERAKIAKQGYTVIATIGDQNSDLAGGSAECGFKLPNPFYFIP